MHLCRPAAHDLGIAIGYFQKCQHGSVDGALTPEAGPFLFTMQYSSCIARLENDQFLTIRASYVKMCNGNTVAAALVSFFEGWHNFKVKQIREWRQTGKKGAEPSTWQHHTGDDLIRGIMGIGRRHSIDQAKEQLIQMGVIMVGRNPDPRFAFDATLHYQFQPDVVNTLLPFVENSKSGPDVEIDASGYAENDKSPFAENSGSIHNNPINQQGNNSTAPEATVPKPEPVKPKKEKQKAAPDKDWQRWVDRWDKFFKDRHDNLAPMFNGAQLGSSGLKGIRRHLTTIATKVDGKSPDDCGFLAWDYLLNHWDEMGDQFLQSQFDLTVVLKKINDILNRLKNGSAQTNRSAYSDGTQTNKQPTGTSEQRNAALRNY